MLRFVFDSSVREESAKREKFNAADYRSLFSMGFGMPKDLAAILPAKTGATLAEERAVPSDGVERSTMSFCDDEVFTSLQLACRMLTVFDLAS